MPQQLLDYDVIMVPVLAALLIWSAPPLGGNGSAPGYSADDIELNKIRAKIQEESDIPKRIEILKTALTSRKSSGDVRELGWYQYMLGENYCLADKAKEGNLAFLAAMPMLKTLEPRERVDRFNTIAYTLSRAKDNTASTVFLRAAVETARASKMYPDLARLEFTLGNVSPNPVDQVVVHARVLEDAAYAGSLNLGSEKESAVLRRLVGDSYAQMAYQAFEDADYKRAIFYFESALGEDAWNEKKMRDGAVRLIVMSSGYSGDWRRAQKYGPEAYRTYRDEGKPDEAAMVLNDIAYAQMEAKRFPDAISGFRKALAETSAATIGQRATILYNLGMTLQEMGKLPEALSAYQEVLAHAKEVDWVRVVNCESSTGMLLMIQSKPKLALPHLLKAAEAIPDIDDLGFAVATLENLEKCHRTLGNKKEAEAAAKRLHQMILNQGGNSEIMRIVLGSTPGTNFSYYYSLAVGNAIRRGDLAEAILHIERSKARTMVDIESRTPIDIKLLSSWESDSYRWLRQRIKKLQDGSGPDISPERAQEQLRFAFEDLNSYETHLRSLIAKRQAKGLIRSVEDRMKLDQIAPGIASLPSDTVMVETIHVASLKQDQVAVILAWSEKGKAKFYSHILAEKGKVLTGKQVEDLSGEFGKACGSSSGGVRGNVVTVEGASTRSGERLKAVLIDPIRSKLARFKRIVISLDERLQRLPIEALPIGNGKCVIDQWEVNYCYSATQWLQSMRMQVRTDPKFPLLIVANPDYGNVPEASLQTQFGVRSARGEKLPQLPGTQVEASRIQGAMPKSTLLTGDKARADAVKALMPKYAVLHFATHGLFDSYNPMASSLAFARPPDGAYATELVAQDIQAMPLKAKLAVLSACDTGRGQFRPGEGSIGLTYAFLRAGCPIVVSSRWAVNDQTTAELMADFYRGLSRRMKVGDALRAAILKTKKKHPQPYHWAPFILFGDSRK